MEKAGDRGTHKGSLSKCVHCNVLESMGHVLPKCKFMLVATDVVTKAFGPMWSPSGVLCPVDKLLVDEPLLSL